MKKIIIASALVLLVSNRVSAQQFEIEQLLLNVEKLAQFKQILQDMKDGYDILKQGYGFIKDVSEGNFQLMDGTNKLKVEAPSLLIPFANVSVTTTKNQENETSSVKAELSTKDAPVKAKVYIQQNFNEKNTTVGAEAEIKNKKFKSYYRCWSIILNIFYVENLGINISYYNIM